MQPQKAKRNQTGALSGISARFSGKSWASNDFQPKQQLPLCNQTLHTFTEEYLIAINGLRKGGEKEFSAIYTPKRIFPLLNTDLHTKPYWLSGDRNMKGMLLLCLKTYDKSDNGVTNQTQTGARLCAHSLTN